MSIIRSKTKVPGDLVITMSSMEFNTKTAVISNPTEVAVTISDAVGYPLVAATQAALYTQPPHEGIYDLAVAGQEAAVVALFMKPNGETIPANSVGTRLCQVLKNPDGVVLNQDKFALLDVAGAAFNQANLQTRLKALGYELREEPPLSEEGVGFSEP